MNFKINNFEEIDFDKIDPNIDEFQLQNGDVFKFVDHVCHVCWDGGTVLENIQNKSLQCLRCKNSLKWISITFELPDEGKGKQESFLLPKDWSDKNIENWKSEFIEIRSDQILVRNSMLKANEGGDYI